MKKYKPTKVDTLKRENGKDVYIFEYEKETGIIRHYKEEYFEVVDIKLNNIEEEQQVNNTTILRSKHITISKNEDFKKINILEYIENAKNIIEQYNDVINEYILKISKKDIELLEQKREEEKENYNDFKITSNIKEVEISVRFEGAIKDEKNRSFAMGTLKISTKEILILQGIGVTLVEKSKKKRIRRIGENLRADIKENEIQVYYKIIKLERIFDNTFKAIDFKKLFVEKLEQYNKPIEIKNMVGFGQLFNSLRKNSFIRNRQYAKVLEKYKIFSIDNEIVTNNYISSYASRFEKQIKENPFLQVIRERAIL